MAKPSNYRLILKAAAIQSVLRSRAHPALPTSAWLECCRLCRLLDVATNHGGFPLAEAQLRTRLQSAANRLLLQTRSFANDSAVIPIRMPSARSVADEIEALHCEFDCVRINKGKHTIDVITEPIELEGIYLGRFRITLDWLPVDNPSRAYHVEALDPNPAATCDSFSHPHVDGETLCAGDGKLAIEAALSQGRVCDFFVLVRQILDTYNSGSAYVQLDEWNAPDCRDCGDSTSQNDMRKCDRCDAEICRHCISGCGDCHDDCCSECTSVCAVCDSETCATCLSECNGCGKSHCERCLQDDECSDCEQQYETEKAATSEAVSPA